MGKVKELESEIPEFNPDTHRWDMEKKELIPFTPEELAEIARQKKRADLNKRADDLLPTNAYYFKAFGGCFNYQKEVLKWDRDNLDDFEQKVLKLEAAKKEMDDEAARVKPMEDRRNEYRKIDELLLEAIAEKQENKAGKMDEYLRLRKEIKDKYPK